MARGFLASWVMALVLAAGCSSSTTRRSAHIIAEGCSLNSDCAKGLVCALGRCREQCVTSVDCHGGSCVTDATGGVCQTADEKNSACEQQRDCPLPLACAADYRCRNLCQSAVDCNVLGVSGRACGTDAQGVKYCAEPEEVNLESGKLITELPPGAPTTPVVEPTLGASFSGGAIAFPIGPAGGTLGLGAVTVTVPAGALDRTLNLTITPITPPVAGSIGQVYEIGPTGTTFRKPVQIAIAYALAELAGKPATAFAVSTVVQGAWQAVSLPIVDPYINTVSGTTMHLSPYALAALGSDGSGGAAGDGSSQAGESSNGGEAGATTDGSAAGGTNSAGGAAGAGVIPGAGTAGSGTASAGGSTGTAGSAGTSAAAFSAVCQACYSASCGAEQKACLNSSVCTLCTKGNYLAPPCVTTPAFTDVADCLCIACPTPCATECSDLGY